MYKNIFAFKAVKHAGKNQKEFNRLMRLASRPVKLAINVVIQPFEPLVMQAVQKLEERFPGYFNDVNQIVLEPGDPGHFGQVRSDQPDTIFVGLDKIKSIVNSQDEEDIVDQIAITLAHEMGHLKSDFTGGEMPAEQEETRVGDVIRARTQIRLERFLRKLAAPTPEQLQRRISAVNEKLESLEKDISKLQSGGLADPELTTQKIEFLKEEHDRMTGQLKLLLDMVQEVGLPEGKTAPDIPPPPSSNQLAPANESADGSAIRETAEENPDNLKEEILKRVFSSATRSLGQKLEGKHREMAKRMLEYLVNKIDGVEDSEIDLNDLMLKFVAQEKYVEKDEVNRRAKAALDRITDNINLHVEAIEEAAKSARVKAGRVDDMMELLEFARQTDEDLTTMVKKASSRIIGLIEHFADRVVEIEVGREFVEA